MNIIQTARLIIRHLNNNDLDELYAICCDPEVVKYVGDGRPLTRSETAAWIEKSLANYQQQGFGCSAVIDRQSGEMIGYCGLIYPGGRPPVEIIYAFHKACWGKGIASEAARAMIDYGLEKCRLTRIYASIDPANQVSIKIVEKLGMRFDRCQPDEHNLPTLYYLIEQEH